jgi:hypothetical protein
MGSFGTTIPKGQTTTQEKATRYLNAVLEDVDNIDADEPEIGNGYVYAHEIGKWERFMLAGNGPTVYAYFLFDEEGDVDHAYIEYCESTGNALAVVPSHRTDELLSALRYDVATGIERHGR